MEKLVIRLDSFIVSGLSLLVFNLFLFSLLKLLSQALCSFHNLHLIYDLKRPLKPRNSRLSLFFGGPLGYLPLVRILTGVIAIYAICAIVLEFSINGSTHTAIEPTLFRSVVSVHPKLHAMRIDYTQEFRPAEDDGPSWVSERLLAVLELQSCMVLNYTHHAVYAYAYWHETLLHTARLVPEMTQLKDAACITGDNFAKGERMHIWGQRAHRPFTCNVTDATLTATYPGTRTPNAVGVATFTLTHDVAKCEVAFGEGRCVARDGVDYCVVIARHRVDTTHERVYFFRGVDAAADPEEHDMRLLSNVPEAERERFVSNMAFLFATGLQGSLHDLMYMSVAHIRHNVMLPRRVSFNVSEIDPRTLVVVLVTVGLLWVLLVVTALVAWVYYVYQRKRQRYNKFTTVDDILNMVGDTEFQKEKDVTDMKPSVFLLGDRPVLRKQM